MVFLSIEKSLYSARSGHGLTCARRIILFFDLPVQCFVDVVVRWFSGLNQEVVGHRR